VPLSAVLVAKAITSMELAPRAPLGGVDNRYLRPSSTGATLKQNHEYKSINDSKYKTF